MNFYRQYLTERNEKEKVDWGVSVLTIGHNIHPARTDYPDKNHPGAYCFNWSKGRVLDEFQIVFISSGRGSFEAEKVGTVQVQPGTVFILFPGVWHRYRPNRESGWEEYWIGFKGSYPDFLMGQDCFHPDLPLMQMGYNAEFLNVFNRLIDAVRYPTEATGTIASCLTIQLLGLIYASALHKEKNLDMKKEIINNIRFKLHEDLSCGLSIKSLAANHNVSYVWFRKAFKDTIGISPGQYHLNLRIDKALQLLRETTLAIAEISLLCGFETESNFSKMFKKRKGMSPSAYREASHEVINNG